ncbi:MAG: rane protein [Pseudomonadota bacterium]|nr:rane protein [Pseudomonadota bacterium]
MRLMDFLTLWYRRVWYILGDELGYFAASLSFYTVFSLIPLFWVLFYVVSQFEAFAMYYSSIKQFLLMNLIPANTVTVSAYLDEFLENSKNMGAVGLFYIFLSSVLFFNNYQYVVNKIFAKADYSLLHAIRTYFVLAILMPTTLAGSFFMSDVIQSAIGKYGNVLHLMSMLSFAMTWALFFVLFKMSPNMRINYKIVLLASLLVAGVWQIAKMLFVHYVTSNQVYTSLYGSFSVMLFFLIWVYFSWYLVLHGLRLCYLLHCRRDYRGFIND